MTPMFLVLPHTLRANAAYPYTKRLAAARRWLQEKGIKGPKPVYRASKD